MASQAQKVCVCPPRRPLLVQQQRNRESICSDVRPCHPLAVSPFKISLPKVPHRKGWPEEEPATKWTGDVEAREEGIASIAH